MKFPVVRLLPVAVLLACQLNAADETVTGNLTVTGSIGAVGQIDSDSNTLSFGPGTSPAVELIYADSASDTFTSKVNRATASWLWKHSVEVPAMRLDSTHQLILYQSNGTTAGVTLTPATNQLSLGTATLTATGTALSVNGAFSVAGGLTNTNGTLTGGATGLTLSAGGTAQNITLTPSTSGNVILIPTGSGNVGIGTSSPGVKLDVVGGGRFTNGSVEVRYMGSGTPAFSSRFSGGTASSPTATPSGSSLGWFLGGGYNGSTWLNTAGMQVMSEEAFTGTKAGTSLRFHTTPSNSVTRGEVMRISPAGDVGIGTSTPAAKLHVNGGGASMVVTDTNSGGGTIRIGASDGTKGQWTYVDSLSSTYFDYAQTLKIRSLTGGTNDRLVVLSSGNVGIGTTSPAHKLEVVGPAANGAGGEGLWVDNNGVQFASRRDSGGGGDLQIGTPNNHNLMLMTNGATKMYLTAGGNVGIGTTAPSTKLHVAGAVTSHQQIINTGSATNVYFAYTNNGASRWVTSIGGNEAGTNSGSDFQFSNYNDAGVQLSTPFTIQRSSGNVGIGTTNPQTKLDVIGSMQVTGNVLQQWGSYKNYVQYPSAYATDPTYLMGWMTDVTTRRLYIDNRNSDSSVLDPSGGITFRTGTTLTDRMHIGNGGNVGVGTTNPSALLQVGQSTANQGFKVGVAGNMANSNAEILNALAVLGTNASSVSVNGAVAWNYYNAGNNPSWSGTFLMHHGSAMGGTLYGLPEASLGELKFQNTSGGVIGTNGMAPIYIAPYGAVAAVFTHDGNVGIGTTAPTHKLSVKGTIRAQEIIVDNTNWADYVFEEDYRLAPLAEVESHIKAKGHLPGIPSAAEVAEHGVSMGEMQAKLLSKIEEITLHQIAQEKQLNAQAARIAQLELENRQLRATTTP